MYIKIQAAATITQQVQDTAAAIKHIIDNHHDALQGIGVTFYFNEKFSERWKLRQIEQAYSIRLQEYIGAGFHRNYYNTDKDLKLEFMINPATFFQEQAEGQTLKTA